MMMDKNFVILSTDFHLDSCMLHYLIPQMLDKICNYHNVTVYPQHKQWCRKVL